MTSKPTGLHLNDPVSCHMRHDFTLLRAHQTVGEALASLREQHPAERIIYFYVVDQEGRLEGVVPTRRLLLNPLDTLIREIMVRDVVAIPADATVLEACEFFILHRFLAFPVVDAERRLLGVVDVELYTKELAVLEEGGNTDDLFQLIGVHLAEARQASPWGSFRSRFPWLLCNVGGGILAAFLAGIFERELQSVVALALFIPVVLALAESVSIQSVSLTLQVMHNKQATWGELLLKLRRELATGFLLGVACAVLVGLVGLIWLRHIGVVFCLLGGISGSVMGAAVLGLSIPYLLHLFSRNPQVAAGPITLALTDMLTLLLYFGLARVLLN